LSPPFKMEVIILPRGGVFQLSLYFRKEVFVPVLVTIVLAFLAGCLAVPRPTLSNKAILQGRVVVPALDRQVQGQALSEATVKIIDPQTGQVIATTTTDGEGNYSVEVPPGGPYIIQAEKGNLKVLDVSPQVESGKSYNCGTADATSTALALLFQAQVHAGQDPTQINLNALVQTQGFNSLVNAVESALSSGQDPTQSEQVITLVNAIVSGSFGAPGPLVPSGPETPARIPVTGVTLDREALVLVKGGSQQLVATVTPANATDKRVTWSSSDDSVATVSQNGVVTAIDVGSAIITVTTVDGGFTARCSVEVSLVVNATKNEGFDSIQGAIDAAENGDTILVAEGVYEEQLVIEKSIVLHGKPGAKIVAPDNMNAQTISGSTHTWYPIVFVNGEGTTVDVTIEGFEIDGGNKAPSSGRYVGILYSEAGGRILDNNLHSLYPPTGSAETFGVAVYGFSNPVDIVIESNEVSDFCRGGIGVSGDYVSATVRNNVVRGYKESETGWWAENGIQIGYGASGRVEHNQVYDCWVNNENWSSTGILVVDTSNVTVSHNKVQNCQTGIGAVDFLSYYGPPWDQWTLSNVAIDHNKLVENQWHIEIANEASNVEILHNELQNALEDGIDVWRYSDQCDGPVNVVINYNKIFGSGSYGVWVEEGVGPVNARNNWWGHPSGPSGDVQDPCDPTVTATGSGDKISDGVCFSPWLQEEP